MTNNNNDLQKAEQRAAAAEQRVAEAKSVVADLEAKRESSIRRGVDLADERANVALAAHTGDDKAAKRLSEIHTAIAVHGSELASLDAALRAASTKVEHASAALAVELKKLDAIKLRAASLAFSAHMKKLDEALDELVNVLFDVEPLRQKLQALGVGPTHEQFCVLGERPLLNALGDTVFEGRVGRRLAPSERTTFTELAAAWSRSHDAEASRVLGDEQTNTAEAAA
jgi:hypothetical protein